MEEEIRKLLGLDDKTEQPALMATLKERLERGTAAITHLGTIGTALDLKKSASYDDLIASLNTRLAAKPEADGKKDGDDEAASLREEVKSLNAKLTSVVTDAAKARAVTAIDAAVQAGKVVPALRDHFISRHMKDPTEVEGELKLMPSLHAGGLGRHKPVETDDGLLDETDAEVAALMGLDPKEFAKTAKQTRREVL